MLRFFFNVCDQVYLLLKLHFQSEDADTAICLKILRVFCVSHFCLMFCILMRYGNSQPTTAMTIIVNLLRTVYIGIFEPKVFRSRITHSRNIQAEMMKNHLKIFEGHFGRIVKNYEAQV